MISGKRWSWALPGLLVAAACMAQAPKADNASVHKQLAQMRKEVQSQQAEARVLKQQVREARQRNTADQASLAQRDREIARLKAQLASQPSKAPPKAKPSKPAKAGRGH